MDNYQVSGSLQLKGCHPYCRTLQFEDMETEREREIRCTLPGTKDGSCKKALWKEHASWKTLIFPVSFEGELVLLMAICICHHVFFYNFKPFSSRHSPMTPMAIGPARGNLFVSQSYLQGAKPKKKSSPQPHFEAQSLRWKNVYQKKSLFKCPIWRVWKFQKIKVFRKWKSLWWRTLENSLWACLAPLDFGGNFTDMIQKKRGQLCSCGAVFAWISLSQNQVSSDQLTCSFTVHKGMTCYFVLRGILS